MKSYRKFFFKYTLMLLFLVFFVNTIATVAQQSLRKIIESDRFFLFLMKNTMLNLDKLSEYKPTDENKLKFNNTLEKIYKNWQLDSKP
jgi:hypothetical protein